MGDQIVEYTVQQEKCLMLESCPNFRDLGGYATGDGGTTQYGRFYRADCLSKLSEADIETLVELDIFTVVDLRHESEIARAANPLAKHPAFTYHNISLVEGAASPDNMDAMPESLAQMYKDLADSAQPKLAEVFRILMGKGEGGAVFHCSAGKDRTGVVAALLLMLAGVSEKQVVDDYAATYPLMQPVFESQLAEAAGYGMALPEFLFRSEPENMRQFIAHIKAGYGDAESYFETLGFSHDEIRALKKMLVEESL